MGKPTDRPHNTQPGRSPDRESGSSPFRVCSRPRAMTGPDGRRDRSCNRRCPAEPHPDSSRIASRIVQTTGSARVVCAFRPGFRDESGWRSGAARPLQGFARPARSPGTAAHCGRPRNPGRWISPPAGRAAIGPAARHSVTHPRAAEPAVAPASQPSDRACGWPPFRPDPANAPLTPPSSPPSPPPPSAARSAAGP